MCAIKPSHSHFMERYAHITFGADLDLHWCICSFDVRYHNTIKIDQPVSRYYMAFEQPGMRMLCQASIQFFQAF
jgi:hypothetical protein